MKPPPSSITLLSEFGPPLNEPAMPLSTVLSRRSLPNLYFPNATAPSPRTRPPPWPNLSRRRLSQSPVRPSPPTMMASRSFRCIPRRSASGFSLD
ncbi:hypothetical protein Godav_019424 [Gossypium davidsonii]|uniref:Uncharacterized protein n=1 Tax=Gossypium davidsonii TaxID=34287 RepID=A0A7J8QZM7_GOSDV|nr:hypothetical protein [Gossypium davidsonii]